MDICRAYYYNCTVKSQIEKIFLPDGIHTKDDIVVRNIITNPICHITTEYEIDDLEFNDFPQYINSKTAEKALYLIIFHSKKGIIDSLTQHSYYLNNNIINF
jgi:hypothetical protein